MVKPAEPRADRGIGNPLRVKLLIEVTLDAHRPDLLDVARPRAESGPAEHMHDRRVV